IGLAGCRRGLIGPGGSCGLSHEPFRVLVGSLVSASAIQRMIPIKSERDIEKMREACASAARVLDKLGILVRPGATTGEVDEAAADFMSGENCRSAFLGYRNFPGNICISVNEEVVHGIGGTR